MFNKEQLNSSALSFFEKCTNEKFFNSSIIVQSKDDREVLDYILNSFAAASCSLKDGYCGVCESCHKVLTNQCQDIINVYPEDDKKSISIEQVRKVREQAVIYPGELNFKVFILHNCDFLQSGAQNALLKILEEPPKSCGFVLICSNLESLLPTIRSRCRVVKFSDQKSNSIDKNIFDQSKNFVKSLVFKDSIQFTTICSSLSDNRDNYFLFLNYLLYILRDICAYKSGVDTLAYLNIEDISDISQSLSTTKTYNLYNIVNDVLIQTQANVNLSISQSNLFNKTWIEINP